MPSGRTSTLHMPRLIGKMNQVHYTPVYDMRRGRKKPKRNLDSEWINYLEETYKKQKQNSDGDSPDALSTYVGMRQPMQLKKVETKYNTPLLQSLKHPRSTPNPDRLHQSKHVAHSIPAEKVKDVVEERAAKRRKNLEKLMAVDTTSDRKSTNSTLHLPQIMKSFLPSVSRKGVYKPSNKSTWIDLTSQKKVRQVAPSDYKSKEKNDPRKQRITFFTVNYDTNPPQKLQRKPLPPLNDSSQSISHKKTSIEKVWHPSDSQPDLHQQQPPTKAQNLTTESKTTVQSLETKQKAMETLLDRLDKARKQNFPPDSVKRSIRSNKQSEFWESSVKPKQVRSSHRKRRESDRHFGNFKSGVVLNKLPSDLVGNFQSTFQNLEYYLGRVSDPRESARSKGNVVHIPTGRITDYNFYDEEIDEDLTEHYFMRRLKQGRNNVKIKYAHRDSNDTPTLDQMPWEEHETRKPFNNENSVAVITSYHNPQIPSNVKEKVVRHVTINMPKVPPPSPEVQKVKSKSRGKHRKAKQSTSENCRFCNNEAEGKVGVKFEKLPNIPVKLPPLLEQPTTEQENEDGLKQSEGQTKQETSLVRTLQSLQGSDALPPATHKSRNKLTENLIAAHGALKRRHKCPKKEVIIAPFKVTIDDEEAQSETKSVARSIEEGSYARSTITKPFTFSYMSSKEKRSKTNKDSMKNNVSKPESQQAFVPEVFNDRRRKPHSNPDDKKAGSSLISSFVSTNQSKQIYNALIMDNQTSTDNVDSVSLDKATDCDGIDEHINPPRNRKVRSHDQIKSQLLSHNNSLADTKEQLIAA